jgi:hypothetical protein
MIGLIHNMLLGLVEAEAGAEAVARVRAVAGVEPERSFTINCIYDDAEWRRLHAAAIVELKVTPEAADEALAEHFYNDALVRWPAWFRMSRNSREFLELQPRIHGSLKAQTASEHGSPGSTAEFAIMPHDGGIAIRYRSANRHCGLYKALARRIIAHYGDAATIGEVACMHQDAPECVIHIKWTRPGDGR